MTELSIISRASLDSSMLFLAFLALAAALLTVRAVSAPHIIRRPESEEALELFGSVSVAYVLSVMFSDEFAGQLPVVAVFTVSAAMLRYYSARLSMPGVIWLMVQPFALVVSALWASLFLLESDLSGWMQTATIAGVVTSAIIFGFDFAERVAREAVMTHERWRLPVSAIRRGEGTAKPRVSVQLPCYAEPPEVVKQTMDRLAAQDYANFEVLVCDNNTKDEALWRPLEAHCAELNRQLGEERFRFFHVSPLPGATAGALNYLLTVMDPDAEIVAVIDADYYARSNFLGDLVGFFDDPRIGYVQTPHDYRDHERSQYLNACYWEYMPNNKVDMPGVSEYGGAFTIGTMCLLRTEGLRKIGGWAEWCLTEDSEVSVRMRAAGYEGYYLGETYGRGLIPDTFDDYKKQRFRWTAGPVQQLRRHWRLFLPAPLAPAMPGWTKVLEILRCVAPLRTLAGVGALGLGLGALIITAALGRFQPIDIPNVGWFLIVLGLATGLARTWHRYRLSGCRSVSEMLMGEVARQSLFYTILVAGVAGLSKKPLAWRRTPKFSVEGSDASPFDVAMPETIAGGATLFVALLVLMSGSVFGGELAFLMFLSLATLALRFLCAPLMAMLSIRHVNGDARDVKSRGGESASALVPEARAQEI